jgi:hypothetical protein
MGPADIARRAIGFRLTRETRAGRRAVQVYHALPGGGVALGNGVIRQIILERCLVYHYLHAPRGRVR